MRVQAFRTSERIKTYNKGVIARSNGRNKCGSKAFLRVVLPACVVAVAAMPATATLFVNDSFDTYANQAAFEASWAPIGTVAPLSAELSLEQSVSGLQSIKVPGYTTTSGSYRNRKTFAESGGVANGK